MNITREEFLARRMTGVGGTDMSVITGHNPYKTEVHLWMEKTGQIPPQDPSLSMRFGIFAEDFVANEYERDHGRKLVRCNRHFRHANGILVGNVDRLAVAVGKCFAVLPGRSQKIVTDKGWEGKTASAFAASDPAWGMPGTDEVPMHYLIQEHVYMELTGIPTWDLSVLFGNQEVRHYTVNRDKEFGAYLADLAYTWWQKHIIGGVAPEPKSDRDVALLYPRSAAAKALEADGEMLRLVTEAQTLQAKAAEIEAQLKGTKTTEGLISQIKTRMLDAEILTVGGKPIATWKSNRDSAKTDWQAIATSLGATPELIAQHTEVKPGNRPFSFK